VPACEPFFPLFEGFDGRAVGVVERPFESASVSSFRFLGAGFLSAAVPFFFITGAGGAARFFDGNGAGFGSVGEVMLSATLAVRLFRRPRSFCLSASIVLRVSWSMLSVVTEFCRSEDGRIVPGVESRGVPIGSFLMAGRGDANCSLSSGGATFVDMGWGVLCIESGWRICEVVGSSRTKAGSRFWVPSRPDSGSSLDREGGGTI
jgi:hypothetical protein